MNDSSASTSPPAADPTPSELEALRKENAALRAQIEHETSGPSGLRRFFAWAFAIVAIVLISTALVVGWAKTTLLDTETFVATLAPLPGHPAVAESLAVRIGDATIEATNLQSSIAGVLPEELVFIAGPVADATGNLVASAAAEVIQTDAFTAVWTTALRTTHQAVLVLLQGRGAIVAEDGTVAIDLDTIAAPALAAVADRGFDLSQFTGDEFTLGEIVLVDSDALGSAQAAVAFLDTLGWFTILLAAAFVGLALLVAPDRRRQLSILGFGSAIAGVINLVSLRLGRGITVGSIGRDVDREAGLAVWDTLLRSLQSGLWALVLIGLVVGAGAWFFGPGRRATRVRTEVGNGIDRWRGHDHAHPSQMSIFFADWRRPLEWAIVGAGFVALLVMPTVSFTEALIVIVIGALLVAVVELIAGPRDTGEPTPDGDADAGQADLETAGSGTS